MPTARPIKDRLLSRVKYIGGHWILPECSNGYTQIKRANRQTITGHLASYEAFIGPLPEGKEIDHLCKVKTCVNPAHLEAVTRQINQHRSNSVSGINAKKTHCINGHALVGNNIYSPPKRPGRRYCRICQNRRVSLSH